MSAIRINRLSAAEAEHVVAKVWCILEKYQIASPGLAVRAQADDLLDIQFAFNAKEDADLVRPELLKTWSAGFVLVPGTSEPSDSAARTNLASTPRTDAVDVMAMD